MSETRFLNGKVLKKSLPLIQVAAGEDQPRLKRLLLPQGELAQFHDGHISVNYLAYVELRQGHARGNHYHKQKEEYIYVITGELSLEVQDIDSLERVSIPLRSGDLAFISVEIAHSMRPVISGHAIEFSETVFDPSDIHRWSLD